MRKCYKKLLKIFTSDFLLHHSILCSKQADTDTLFLQLENVKHNQGQRVRVWVCVCANTALEKKFRMFCVFCVDSMSCQAIEGISKILRN